jgi:protein subunit release factor B
MEFISIAISSVFLIVSSFLAIKSQIPKQTIQNQKELIETYEKRLKALEDQSEQDKKQHIENVKAIADLQGQLKVYKEIPLQEIANSMKELSATNKQILTYIHTPAKVTEQTIKTTQKG